MKVVALEKETGQWLTIHVAGVMRIVSGDAEGPQLVLTVEEVVAGKIRVSDAGGVPLTIRPVAANAIEIR